MARSTTISLPPRVRAVYERARRRWMLALLTPIIYLALAQLMRSQGWIAGPEEEHRWDTAVTRGVLLATAGGLVVGLFVLRWQRGQAVKRYMGEPGRALRKWMVHFYYLAMAADTLAFLSLIYFAISGRFEALLAGGLAAYLGYAVAYPGWEDLVGMAEPGREED